VTTVAPPAVVAEPLGFVRPVTEQTIAAFSAVAAASVIRRRLGVPAVNVGAVVVDTANAWPPLVQVAERAPAAVNVGKPVTEIMVGFALVLTPVRLMVTVEVVDTTLLLNAMDAPEKLDVAGTVTPLMVSKLPEPSFVMIFPVLAAATVFGFVRPVTAQTIAAFS